MYGKLDKSFDMEKHGNDDSQSFKVFLRESVADKDEETGLG